MSTEPSSERFELPITVEPADIDELGHVNNVVYVRWVQEIATAHWRAAATPEQQAEIIWVVLRHEIDYKSSAMPGDELTACTWVGAAAELQFERFTEIVRRRDGRVLASARTLWCPIRTRTGRPARVDQDIRKRFSTNAETTERPE